MEKEIEVALGILIEMRPPQEGGTSAEPRQHILISRRPARTVYGGYWEFPGGKVEPDETPEQALIRELKEELGILVTPGQALDPVIHTYPHARVRLNPYFCTREGGEIQNLGVEDHRWVLPEDIRSFNFPEANLPVIDQMLRFLCSRALVEG